MSEAAALALLDAQEDPFIVCSRLFLPDEDAASAFSFLPGAPYRLQGSPPSISHPVPFSQQPPPCTRCEPAD